MKKILALLLVSALWLSAPAVVFAAETNAPEEADPGQGDPGDTEDQSPLDEFELGMPKEAAKEMGAEPASGDPNVMTASRTWRDVEWQVILMFNEDGVKTIAMQTDINHRVLPDVFGNIEDHECRPAAVMGPDGKHISFFEMTAAGKSDDEVKEVFDAALSAFADADKGRFMALYILNDVYDEAVEAEKKKKGGGEEYLETQDGRAFAVQMDKADDKLTVMSSTIQAMYRQ